jgi:deferrochelatase/peroxidase EfeB
VRDFLKLLLVRIADPAAARASLARIAGDPGLMKSAASHFDELHEHRASHADGTAFVEIALSRSGYQRLGVPSARFPLDDAFREGMAERGDVLRDPPAAEWEYAFPLDAMFIIGSHSAADTAERVRRVCAELRGIEVVKTETGRTLRKDGNAIEHFGYVDGRSQPLFIREDVERERDTTDGVSVWNPEAPLDRVLVPDPGITDRAECFGSYLIYRKLEQNVPVFEKNEKAVEQLLGLAADDKERAGALLVGRFEDGTPVVLQSGEHGPVPVPNNFTYADDERGRKCPHFAHIRVMNTRHGDPESRIVIARRGQTYGARPDLTVEGARAGVEAPSTGVGLLFMAVVSDIPAQFERLQRMANGRHDLPRDPVVGQGPRKGPPFELPNAWGGDQVTAADPKALKKAVTMKGGEYFFLPSITFLQRLG